MYSPRCARRKRPSFVLQSHLAHGAGRLGAGAADWPQSTWMAPGEIREQVPQHRAPVRRTTRPSRTRRDPQAHIADFGPFAPDELLFVGAHGGPVTDRTYLRVFHVARCLLKEALSR